MNTKHKLTELDSCRIHTLRPRRRITKWGIVVVTWTCAQVLSSSPALGQDVQIPSSEGMPSLPAPEAETPPIGGFDAHISSDSDTLLPGSLSFSPTPLVARDMFEFSDQSWFTFAFNGLKIGVVQGVEVGTIPIMLLNSLQEHNRAFNVFIKLQGLRLPRFSLSGFFFYSYYNFDSAIADGTRSWFQLHQFSTAVLCKYAINETWISNINVVFDPSFLSMRFGSAGVDSYKIEQSVFSEFPSGIAIKADLTQRLNQSHSLTYSFARYTVPLDDHISLEGVPSIFGVGLATTWRRPGSFFSKPYVGLMIVPQKQMFTINLGTDIW